MSKKSGNKQSLKDQLELAMAHQTAGRLNEAESIYQSILKEDAEQPDAIHLLGLVRMEQEDDEAAVKLMEQALVLFPEAAHFHHNIAGLYRRTGRLEEAEVQFREAIRLKPDYGEAFQGLAEMVKFSPGDPLVQLIDTQLRRSDLDDNMRSYFHFAAGKILDDIGDYPLAFQHYDKGNSLTHRSFDSKAFRDLVKELLYTHSRTHVERMGNTGRVSEVPTFIIGMPRSGTTLVEQILASHSEVYGAGELNDMKVIAALSGEMSKFDAAYPACLAGLNPDDYGRLADEYLKRIEVHAGEASAKRIIDKHPLNFQFVGLIFSMFPNARVIHTVRNPLDTCLSCYFQNFTKGQDYSFNLVSLAHFYNDYRRIMEHWETIYPGRILTVRYEDVIERQEEETRRLLTFMGLDFEEACLQFHQTERKVSTASFMQVRKPLYGTSRQRWKNYRSELSSLAQIIGIGLEEPVTISRGSSILS